MLVLLNVNCFQVEVQVEECEDAEMFRLTLELMLLSLNTAMKEWSFDLLFGSLSAFTVIIKASFYKRSIKMNYTLNLKAMIYVIFASFFYILVPTLIT